MKTMTCLQLGGACEMEFHAATFEEMASLSRGHAMEMMQKQDAAHLEAMKTMGELMQNPEAMKAWMVGKQKQFDDLPDEP